MTSSNLTSRRSFLKTTALSSSLLLSRHSLWARNTPGPNLVFVFADQWRAQATGFAGDPNAQTPHLDRLARESINFTHAVSGCPVCSPFRASLMTGQYPLTHGVFLNDVPLSDRAVSFAQVFNRAGYHTGYIGKWHLDGRGRNAYIPRQRRQGFQFWQVLECTHNYNHSIYYGDENTPRLWKGYDAIAQTRAAQDYIRRHAGQSPFTLFLSWGPPHAPYQTAPPQYRERYHPDRVLLRPNVPDRLTDRAKKDLAGYYAHIAALDDCLADLLNTLKETGIEKNTIFVFTADHGDMLYSHGRRKKQQPQDESIRVPFLLRYPAVQEGPKVIDVPINSPDIMPTILSLAGLSIPDSVEGDDFAPIIRGTQPPPDNRAVLIACPSPFGQWRRRDGGREYRGVRTKRYTYVRDLTGPWLLYDNENDPYQLRNICHRPEYTHIRAQLDAALNRELTRRQDHFLSGWNYIKQWGYEVDENGTVPYRHKQLDIKNAT